jgi:undecaprenyl-diphosphatase
MTFIEAIILGIIQGLTEFLPVSSSGHIELGKALLGIELEENLGFTVLVHFATVLSTITVFYKDIRRIAVEVFRFQWNESTHFVLKILVSMVPVLIVGLLFEETIEQFFSGNLVLVGGALLVTATLLSLTYFFRNEGKRNIPYLDALIMGLAQAFAVIPGLSRSGSTIAAGLLLKNDKEAVTRFSFLMVLLPIIGAAFMKMIQADGLEGGSILTLPMMAGFVSAYISGFLACRWMIAIVKRGKLIWFAVYCAIIGIVSILFAG